MGKIDCNVQVDMWHDFPVELPWTSGGFTVVGGKMEGDNRGNTTTLGMLLSRLSHGIIKPFSDSILAFCCCLYYYSSEKNKGSKGRARCIYRKAITKSRQVGASIKYWTFSSVLFSSAGFRLGYILMHTSFVPFFFASDMENNVYLGRHQNFV